MASRPSYPTVRICPPTRNGPGQIRPNRNLRPTNRHFFGILAADAADVADFLEQLNRDWTGCSRRIAARARSVAETLQAAAAMERDR